MVDRRASLLSEAGAQRTLAAVGCSAWLDGNCCLMDLVRAVVPFSACSLALVLLPHLPLFCTGTCNGLLCIRDTRPLHFVDE
jgi:hypothetical protein